MIYAFIAYQHYLSKRIDDIDNAISVFVPLDFRNNSHNDRKCTEKVMI